MYISNIDKYTIVKKDVKNLMNFQQIKLTFML